jgi:segregation and condensation protein B
MSPQSPQTPAEPGKSSDSPLSLTRLREAFAAMLGTSQPASTPVKKTAKPAKPGSDSEARVSAPCPISPRSVAEAILFVGRPDNGPIPARELAAAMRGVSPAEVEVAIAELNELYDADQTPYFIEQSPAGYRMVLRPAFERVRDKFYGRVKEATLSATVLEVLSVLAYNQPATAAQLSELRGAPCGAALATLVRRKLVSIERSNESQEAPRYSTTDRFLKLFNLESLAALPRSEELEKV